MHGAVSLARSRSSRRLGHCAAFTFALRRGRSDESLSPRGLLLELFDSPGFELPGSSTDGGLGDDDLAANGTLVDQGGPGAPGAGAGAAMVPTLSEWALLLLAALLLLSGWAPRTRMDAR